MHYDELRQRHLQTLFTRMPAHIDRLAWTRERLAEWQRVQLRELIAHAIANSPFHRERLGHVDVDAPLEALPTMSKRDLSASFDDIVTDRRVTREVAEDHLASLDDGDAYLLEEYHVIATGGSSGARAVLVWDWDGWADCFLSLGRRNLVRATPEERPVMASVIGDHASHMAAAIMATFSNPMITIYRVSASKPVEAIVEQLNKIQPDTLQGYPTMLHRMAIEQRAGRLRISPTTVLSGSETLTAETQELLEEIFGVATENSYGTSEAGGMATPCGNGPWMHLNDDLNIVEVEDERVFVTNLMNKVMPLIRYELDDRVVLDNVDCPCGTEHGTVVEVQGRTSEIFHFAGGAEIHPVLFSTAIGAHRFIADYQVRQRGEVLEIDVVPAGDFDATEIVTGVERTLAEAGATAKLCLRTVENIPRHPITGKAARFVPEPPDGNKA